MSDELAKPLTKTRGFHAVCSTDWLGGMTVAFDTNPAAGGVNRCWRYAPGVGPR
ncbi:MAG: hypothetical protein GY850_25120 [bacterium]|nr:hypothetical protein [bacterium]